jgi:hypothetical protein
MGHIKYKTGEGQPERWTIDREFMRKCVRCKCPHLSFGTCLKPKCILFPKETHLELIK